MKGIAGRMMRGLPVGARLDCIDNTGAKIVQIIMTLKMKGVHRRYPKAETGETKGTMIKGPVSIEAAERWPKIASLASIIV